MDECDVAAHYEEMDRAIGLQDAKAIHGPAETGVCLAQDCGEPLEPGRRWCNAECRDEWEKEQAALMRAGKVRNV